MLMPFDLSHCLAIPASSFPASLFPSIALDLIHDRTSAQIPAVSNKDRLIILGSRTLLPKLKSLPFILLAAADSDCFSIIYISSARHR